MIETSSKRTIYHAKKKKKYIYNNKAINHPSDSLILPHSTKYIIMKPTEFRQLVRKGRYSSPTNGKCPDYLQCNLVVLRGSDAFDFLLFCQRNEKACPLIEVCDVGSSIPKYCCRGEHGSADLKTDIPKLVLWFCYFQLLGFCLK